MKHLYLLLCVFLFSLSIHAEHEKIISLKNIQGEYTITSDVEVTAKDAKEKARENAKRNALSQISGKLNSWEYTEISSEGESYNSLSLMQINGEIMEFNIVEEGHRTNEAREKEIVFYCIANVKIKKGVDPDPSFVAKVENIKSNYFNAEQLECIVTTSQNAYLRIFVFENSEVGYSLFPNDTYHSKFIGANRKTLIPGDINDFTLSTTKEIETNIFVFLFTKEERPFNLVTSSRNDIEKWIAQIPNDQKYLYCRSVNIIKK